MKTQIINLFNPLHHTEAKDLALAVKPTMSEAAGQKHQPVFISAELWNIQRQRKGFQMRRGFSFL